MYPVYSVVVTMTTQFVRVADDLSGLQAIYTRKNVGFSNFKGVCMKYTHIHTPQVQEAFNHRRKVIVKLLDDTHIYVTGLTLKEEERFSLPFVKNIKSE